MLPVADASGEVTSYAMRVSVVAENPGKTYAVPEGVFSRVDPFSPYLLFGENEQPFTGGKDAESAQELQARLGESVTTRGIQSDRAIKALLRDEFSSVTRVVTQGFTDAAMQRDLIQDQNAFYRVHQGGCVDIYIDTPLRQRVVHVAQVGAATTLPVTRRVYFRDETVADWRSRTRVGAVINIHNARQGEPTRYVVEEVNRKYLRVSSAQPFPDDIPSALRGGTSFTDARITAPNLLRSLNAEFQPVDIGKYVRITASSVTNAGDYRITDISSDNTTATLTGALTTEVAPTAVFHLVDLIVDYSVGNNVGGYDNHVSRRTSGRFSRALQKRGHVIMPARPIYKIHEVYIPDPNDALTNPVTERIEFIQRSNAVPQPHEAGLPMEYQLEQVDVHVAQSGQQLALLRLAAGVEQQGSFGKLTRVAGVNYFAAAASAIFSEADVGKILRVVRAVHTTNRGEWRIVALQSPQLVSVQSLEDSGREVVAEGRLRWELSDADRFDGKTVHIVYDTLSDFDAINDFVSQPRTRSLLANTLVRGLHPVYLSFEIQYFLRTATPQLLDEGQAIAHLAAFISTYQQADALSVSTIVNEFSEAFAEYVNGVQLPLAVTYILHAPDGRLINYTTTDLVLLSAAKLADKDDQNRLAQALQQGVSDQTVRYIADVADIKLTRLVL